MFEKLILYTLALQLFASALGERTWRNGRNEDSDHYSIINQTLYDSRVWKVFHPNCKIASVSEATKSPFYLFIQELFFNAYYVGVINTKSTPQRVCAYRLFCFGKEKTPQECMRVLQGIAEKYANSEFAPHVSWEGSSKFEPSDPRLNALIPRGLQAFQKGDKANLKMYWIRADGSLVTLSEKGKWPYEYNFAVFSVVGNQCVAQVGSTFDDVGDAEDELWDTYTSDYAFDWISIKQFFLGGVTLAFKDTAAFCKQVAKEVNGKQKYWNLNVLNLEIRVKQQTFFSETKVFIAEDLEKKKGDEPFAFYFRYNGNVTQVGSLCQPEEAIQIT